MPSDLEHARESAKWASGWTLGPVFSKGQRIEHLESRVEELASAVMRLIHLLEEEVNDG